MKHVIKNHRTGFACILAILLIAIFLALVMAFAGPSALSLASSNNYNNAMTARLTAESGVSFMLNKLQPIRLPGTINQASFCGDITTVLNGSLNGTENLAGQPIRTVNSAVVIPEIAIPFGKFTSQFDWIAADRCRLKVDGTSRGATQRVSINLLMIPRRAAAFDYGLASNGQIIVSGNARIVGVNDPTEASILSATQSHNDAISLGGNVVVSGELYTSGDNTYVALSGSPTVAGAHDSDTIAQHIHLGINAPDFPAVDTSALATLATNVINSGTNLNQPSFDNVRITANTNPTFSSDVVLNGIIFIEAPNVVRFSGKATINGMVATEDKNLDLNTCQISFSGGVEARGVETLPDSPIFAAIKQQTGTFVVAPGFAVTFAGNFGAVNGSIAADQLTFTGSAEGVVRGSVIGLEDKPTSVGGNVDIFVDRANANQNPAGFVKSLALVPEASSYQEVKGP